MVSPVLQWEVELFLNKLNQSPGNFLEDVVIRQLTFVSTFKIPVTVDQARLHMKCQGPHPDAWNGTGLGRGSKLIWEENITDASDATIPQAIIDDYTNAGWDTATTPWTPPQ